MQGENTHFEQKDSSAGINKVEVARNTVMRPVWKLIGGAPTMTMREMAQRLQCPLDEVDHFWISAGFARADPDKVMFTEKDLEAIKTWQEHIHDGHLYESTTTSLLRAQSHMNDRLVLWQLEALVADFQERYSLEDTDARLMVLDKIDNYIDMFQSQVAYAWRRQLAALLINTNQDVVMREKATTNPQAYPLERSMGFVDMVAYTRRTSMMTAHALSELVQRFDTTSRDVITSRGGRVVKTIGDAVLFVAHEVTVAADIVCALIETLKEDEQMLPVRASLVHGWVVSRSGDIFGPPVNLASRLVDIAHRGQIFTDADTVSELEKYDQGRKFYAEKAEIADLHGLGEVQAYTLNRVK